jgi:hypothetical protein
MRKRKMKRENEEPKEGKMRKWGNRGKMIRGKGGR